MPIELRRLIFSRDELVGAIAGFRDGANNAIPAGNIVHCQIVHDSELHVAVKILPEGETQIESARLDINFISAALIKYCKDKKIPIPRESEKSIEAMGENMALVIRLGKKPEKFPDGI